MAMYYKQNNEWKKIFVSKEEISDDVLNSKQDKLSKEQLDNITAIPNKIDNSAVGNGLKFADGKLQLDIPVATASTTYGGDAQ